MLQRATHSGIPLSMDSVVYFSDCLQRELSRRCRSNPLYSMRAFSKTLGVNVSILSRLLRRETLPSPKTAEKILSRLDLTSEESNLVLKVLQSERIQTKRSKLLVLPDTAIDPRKPKDIAVATFEQIADWYYYAILELTFVKGFKSDTRWISSQLGISPTEASLAIEKLLRLGLLERRHGRLRKTEASITTADKASTNQALRRRQKQVLNKSIDALENVDISKRDHAAITMAIDPKKIPEAKAKILKFTQELCEFLESGEKKCVYELAVGLIPLQVMETESC